MTVKQLMSLLATMPPEHQVVLAGDQLGNDHYPLSEHHVSIRHARQAKPPLDYKVDVWSHAEWLQDDWCHDADEPWPGNNAVVLGP